MRAFGHTVSVSFRILVSSGSRTNPLSMSLPSGELAGRVRQRCHLHVRFSLVLASVRKSTFGPVSYQDLHVRDIGPVFSQVKHPVPFRGYPQPRHSHCILSHHRACRLWAKTRRCVLDGRSPNRQPSLITCLVSEWGKWSIFVGGRELFVRRRHGRRPDSQSGYHEYPEHCS